MIKDVPQYLVTLRRVSTFEQALATAEGRKVNGKPMRPLQLEAWREALRSQLDDLREEIAEYEASHPDVRLLHEERELVEL